MQGLNGFLYGLFAAAVSFLLSIAAAILALTVGGLAVQVFYATLVGFATMLVFVLLMIFKDKGWIDFHNSYLDILAPIWMILAIVFMIMTFLIFIDKGIS